MTTDFMQNNPITSFTVRAVWYLNHFFSQQSWETGLSFEQELRQIGLDYSFESFKRIDDLLTQIHAQQLIDEQTFLTSESHQNFIFLLAFYCGEFVGRVRGQAPIWYDYAQFVEIYPQVKDKIPKTFMHCIIVKQVKDELYAKDKIWFPLMMIQEKLFNKNPQASVYQAIRQMLDQHQHIKNEQCFTVETTQSLGLDLTQQIEQLPVQALSYLQQIPSQALLNQHPCYQNVEYLNYIYQQGKCVWAVLLDTLESVQQEAMPVVDVIYDPNGRTDFETLREVAKKIHELQQVGHALSAEFLLYLQQNQGRITALDIPKDISPIPLKISSLYVWRPHLPDGELSSDIVPIILVNLEAQPYLTILPAYFWKDTAFYHYWLKAKPDYSLMYFNHLLQETEYWQEFTEFARPTREQLLNIGRQFTQLVDMPMPDEAFYQKLQPFYQTLHRQYVKHLATISEENLSMSNEQSSPSIQQYDFSSAMAELVNPQLNQALGLQPLLQIDKAIHYPQLTAEQSNKLLDVLLKGTQKGNTTSMLYLAYLYLTGKYVNYSLEQANDLILGAINAGDWRGYTFKTEVLKATDKEPSFIIEQYEQAIAQGHPTIHEKMAQFAISLAKSQATAQVQPQAQPQTTLEINLEPVAEPPVASTTADFVAPMVNEQPQQQFTTQTAVENTSFDNLQSIHSSTDNLQSTHAPLANPSVDSSPADSTPVESSVVETPVAQNNTGKINIDDMTEEQRIELYEKMRANQAVWKDVQSKSKIDFSNPMVRYGAIGIAVILVLLIIFL